MIWKVLKNINYFMTSKSGLVAPLLRDTLCSVHYLFMVNFRQLNPLFLFLLEWKMCGTAACRSWCEQHVTEPGLSAQDKIPGRGPLTNYCSARFCGLTTRWNCGKSCDYQSWQTNQTQKLKNEIDKIKSHQYWIMVWSMDKRTLWLMNGL